MSYKVSFLNNIKNIITEFISKGHERTVEAKKNIASSFVIKLFSVAINLILIPLTINYVNAIEYGIWITLSSIIAWFSFFDIGFGNGLRNRFTEAKASGDFENAKIYVSTTYAVLILIFSGVWILFLIGNIYIDWAIVLNSPKEMALDLSKLAIIVFSFFCLQMVLKTISTVIIADQKPAKAAFLDLMCQFLSLLIIFILTKTTKGSLIYLGLTLGLSQAIIFIVGTIFFYTKEYKPFAPSFNFINFSYAKDIMKLGYKFFIIQIAFIVIFQTNNIIIAQVAGPEDVTVFSIAYKYIGIALMIFSVILSPYWSAYTEAYTKKDYQWMKVSLKSLRIISYLFVAAVIVLVMLSSYVYKLWLGDLVSIPIPVSVSVGVYVSLLILVYLNTQILNGIGKVKLQLLSYTLATVFHVPLAIFLGSKFGIIGVVFSACIFYVIISIVSIVQVNLIISQKAKGIWNS